MFPRMDQKYFAEDNIKDKEPLISKNQSRNWNPQYHVKKKKTTLNWTMEVIQNFFFLQKEKNE